MDGPPNMKLYVTFTSPYARLARILIIEKTLEDRVEIIPAKTRRPKPALCLRVLVNKCFPPPALCPFIARDLPVRQQCGTRAVVLEVEVVEADLARRRF